MGASTVSLTVRSIDNTALASSLTALFVVERMGLIIANQNTLTADAVTEAGDASNQLSAWTLFGSGTQTLGWELTDSGGDYTVALFSNTNHDKVVATGTRTGNGALFLYPVNDSGISGSVTIAYSGDDIDAANTVKITSFVATNDLQLPGNTQFEYLKDDGQVIKYTVDETVSAINTAIDGAGAYLEATVSLTNAQIAILNGTPVVAIATPGAGYMIEVLSAVVVLTYGGAAITGNVTMDLIYTTTLNEIGTCTNAFSGAASKNTKMITTAGAIMSNEGVTLIMDSGDPTMGASTSTAVVKITYKKTATT